VGWPGSGYLLYLPIPSPKMVKRFESEYNIHATQFLSLKKLYSMLISVATATFYFLPFDEALETIAQAGFENIELDLFWERKNWAMAQHLKGISAREAVHYIAHAGLHVSSIHDGGGVLDDNQSIQGYINPVLVDYLDNLGYSPDCLVFHPPHIEGAQDQKWWDHISAPVAKGLDAYKRYGATITIENEPEFEGYTVALTTPQALNEFALKHALGVTLDTTHYAYSGVDIVDAAQILRETVRTIHLSDFRPDALHAFIGEGNLNLLGFFRTLDLSLLKSITLECSPATIGQSERNMSKAERIDRLKLARNRAENLLL
jgi:sugar phosphate isomerase/epimerase